MRRSAENLLYITTHVQVVQDLIALINHEVLHIASLKRLVTHETIHTARCSDKDVGTFRFVCEHGLVLLDRGTAIDDGCTNLGHVFCETRILVADLVCKLARVTQHKHRHFSIHRLQLLE